MSNKPALICDLFLSMAAHTTDFSDPFPRHTVVSLITTLVTTAVVHEEFEIHVVAVSENDVTEPTRCTPADPKVLLFVPFFFLGRVGEGGGGGGGGNRLMPR